MYVCVHVCVWAMVGVGVGWGGATKVWYPHPPPPLNSTNQQAHSTLLNMALQLCGKTHAGNGY